MTALERRCRLLLRVYPAAYRQDRGEEIIGTLLEATPAGRSWPGARELRGIALGGLRARAALNRRLTTTANLRIAALVGVTVYLAFALSIYVIMLTRGGIGWPSLPVAALVVMAGTLAWVSRRRGLVLTAVIAAAIAVSLVFSWRLSTLGIVVTVLACLAAVALLGRRDERPGRRWLPAVALVAAIPLLSALTSGTGHLVFGPLLAGLGILSLLWMVIDARPAIATAVFLLALWLPSGIDNLARGSGIAAGVPLLVIVSAMAALAIWRLRRQSAGSVASRGG
jgi:hypothetical protein